MLSILGEGRGHMTQAMAVKETVEKAGHQVVRTVLGMGSAPPGAPILVRIRSDEDAELRRYRRWDFSVKNHRQVQPAPRHSLESRGTLPAYLAAGVRTLKSPRARSATGSHY